MVRALVLFCAVLALVKGWTTQVDQCINSSSGPRPINVNIHGCSTQPCGLSQGQDASIQVIFRAPRDIRQMRTLAMAYLGVIPIQYDLGSASETCNSLMNTNCPVEQNEIILYTLKLPIEEFMPAGTQLPIEFRIVDESNRAITCFRVLSRILPPVNQLGVQNATISVEA